MTEIRFISLPEVAERLGVSYQTAWRMAQDGRLPGSQLSTSRGRWRFDPAVVDALLAKKASTSPAGPPLPCPDADAISRALTTLVSNHPEIARQLADVWNRVAEREEQRRSRLPGYVKAPEPDDGSQ